MGRYVLLSFFKAMSFSSIKYDDGSSFFSLGKRNAESFDQINFNEHNSKKKFCKQNSMTTTSNTKKTKIPLKKSVTQDDKRKKVEKSKKRKIRVESSSPYTFEGIQATPSQFYNKFEELLNQNTKMNQGLRYDVDGLEKNLSKLQQLSKGKPIKDQQSGWLSS